MDKILKNSFEIGTFSTNIADLTVTAEPIAKELVGSVPFCLWLVGGMGAGKTTFTGALLHSMGLDPDMPVTSPTFTYLNEYMINNKWYAHIDLYRASAGFSLEELGFVDSRNFAGYFIEWPGAIDDTSEVLPPSHILQIDSTTETSRDLRFFRVKGRGYHI